MTPEERRGQAAEEAAAAVAALRERGIAGPFDLALVLGTGLGPLADEIEEAVRAPYRDLPGFPGHGAPAGGVSGHAKELVAGRLAGRRVLALNGRAHYYERGDSAAMRGAVAAVAALGCPRLLLTNAAGSLHEEWPPPSLALISDHINWSGLDPLIGDGHDARFVSLTDAYDPAFRRLIAAAAAAEGIPLPEGVYVWFSGPSFETPAEIRLARLLGGSIVGMSTVPEVILARRFGLPVAAISMLTNLAAGMQGSSPSHDETKRVAAAGGEQLRRLVRAVIARL